MSDLIPSSQSDNNYQVFLDDLKQRIRQSQVRASLAVNQELIQLYWTIGQDILSRQRQEGWGTKVIAKLAQDLKREFPDIRGFSRSNLMYMRAFAAAYPDPAIVQRTVGQLPWRHNIALLDKLKDEGERLWYAERAIEHGWSRDVLVLQIETGLHRRLGEAVTNFQRALPKPQSDLAQQLIKDPYHFDFLTLEEATQERDLEKALIERIRDFLLELGVGFAFVGSQYHLVVDDDDYYIDLLFYHIKLKCYIVIDLKITPFQPEYSGKMNFYVSAVNRLLRDDLDNPTIGIILCRSKKKTVVEFALDTVQNPIGVSTYRLRDELPPDLQGNLPSPEQFEIEIEAAVGELKQNEEHQPPEQ